MSSDWDWGLGLGTGIEYWDWGLGLGTRYSKYTSYETTALIFCGVFVGLS